MSKYEGFKVIDSHRWIAKDDKLSDLIDTIWYPYGNRLDNVGGISSVGISPQKGFWCIARQWTELLKRSEKIGWLGMTWHFWDHFESLLSDWTSIRGKFPKQFNHVQSRQIWQNMGKVEFWFWHVLISASNSSWLAHLTSYHFGLGHFTSVQHTLEHPSCLRQSVPTGQCYIFRKIFSCLGPGFGQGGCLPATETGHQKNNVYIYIYTHTLYYIQAFGTAFPLWKRLKCHDTFLPLLLPTVTRKYFCSFSSAALNENYPNTYQTYQCL